MNQTIESVGEGIEQICALPLIRLTISNPRPGAAYRRVTLRPVELRGKPVLQLEQFTETQAFHRHILPEEACGVLTALMAHYGQLDATCQGAVFCLKISKKGKLFFSRQAAKTVCPVVPAHNRQKQYLLQEGMIVPPLVDLGVLTEDGRIVRAKYDKFRQINRFLEFLDDVLARDTAPVIRIVDFGCGKSYLTFVVYYYITQLLHREAQITGLDLKQEVIDHCNQVAEKYGYTNLHFFCGDIRDYVTETPPDLVITLHACDTATDYALYHAIRWGARYIFSVPCCQHEMNAAVGADALLPITGYGILKERLCALATDGVRAKLLESRGYDVQILEFIDLEHSPKNLLLRAKKAPLSAARRTAAGQEADGLLTQLGGKNTLRRLLQAETQGVIRPARAEELDEIMALYDTGRQFMRAHGNTVQWTDGYPYRSMLEEDLRLGRCYVNEVEGRLHVVFALITGDDPTYAQIDGAWRSDGPYGTIHRMASSGVYPGAASRCIRWCFDRCGNLRADTHDDNAAMRHTLEKNGFVYCGTIVCDDGTPRRAYQKID